MKRPDSIHTHPQPTAQRILRKDKYPPDKADSAVELVLQQAEALGEAWEEH